MPKKAGYILEFDGCFIKYFTGGKVKWGGKVSSYEFICNCDKVVIHLESGLSYTLDYQSYLGPETKAEWKQLFCDLNCGGGTEPTEPIEPVKQPLEPSWYTLNTDEPDKFGNKPSYCIRAWFDGTNMCYVMDGDVPQEDGSNLITIENYTKMNIAGAVVKPNLAKLTKPDCVEVHLGPGASKTYADILAEAITNGTLLPDGTPPTGFINPTVVKYQIGQLGKKDDGTKAKDGSQAIELGDLTINAADTRCLGVEEAVDNDGDCFLRGEDLTKTFTNCSTKEDAFFLFCATFIPLDADDADDGVQ